MATKRRSATHSVADLGLAPFGVRRIEWAARAMPVLEQVRTRFEAERPFDGVRIAACMHVTAETAHLVRTLAAGGADVALCAANPLSTQDDTAAALVREYGISVHAAAGVDRDGYYAHIDAALDAKPDLVLDDGCDLTSTLHAHRPELLDRVRGGCEGTTTGVVRLRQMTRAGALRVPMLAVNDTRTKRMFDNRYGTGQSTVDAIMRATNMLLAGRTVVVAGFGYCGRGVAERARGLGAHVVVTEIDPIKALDATMQGYPVEPMEVAAARGDVFVTVTGNRDVVTADHFALMKDGAVLANSGHFDVEIDVRALRELADDVVPAVRPHVDEYVLRDGRRLLLISEGRLANLGAAEGHPASVMDLSFAGQALATAWLAANADTLDPGVHDVPEDIGRDVAALALEALGVRIDALTTEQRRYLGSWEHGS
ncbi:MAG: adenosylhomocysteinase [Streptosporangiales bacterium]|nr:adenosylhomocysteinase [Streptosporangiales bacterium]